MAYIFNNEISFSDSPFIDAFNRLRVSNPQMLFANSLTLTSGDTYFQTYLSGSATATYDINQSEFNLSVTAAGARAMREQHGYSFYQAGKSQIALMTGVFGSGTTNVIKRMGYFNDSDGLFFVQSGTTFGVVLRTSTSGSIIEYFYPQSDWNIDTLDTGSTLNPSGFHLDVSKTNIYIINFQWLGVGRVVFALDLDGRIIPVHQILNANNKTEVYMKTGNLPIRYEITSSGGSDTLTQICSTVISEGGQEDYGYVHTAAGGLSTKTISSRESILSVRLANNFEGKTNRTLAMAISLDLFTTTSTVNAYWELILQRGYLGENNLGGSPTWTGITKTPLEMALNGTTVTGGIVLDSGYLNVTSGGGAVGSRTQSIDLLSKYVMALDYSGTTSDWLHLVITPSVSSAWSGKISLNCKY